ncbi:MAG: phospholipase D-like domain-containing protein [Nitrospirota bacterium]
MQTGNGIKPVFTRPEIERLYGSSFTDGNNVQLLWKSKELFKMIFDSVSKAKRLICLEFYIFRNDETGAELARLLKKKAREGVYIYILYDHFGSIGTPRKFWEELKRAGINVRGSRPFKWTAPLRYAHRDHKKLIIIDGEKAFTGGLNIANEYSGYYFKRLKKRKEGWRDTGIMLEGPIALTLLNTFRKSWVIWGGEPIVCEGISTRESSGLPVLPIFASSARGRRKLRRLLYYSINHARQSIFLTTAYFTPSRRMAHILSEAVKKGVDVKLLLPSASDISAAHYAGRASFAKLLKAGVEIYNYRGEILHAKTSVFDERWSIIGSANLDFQSLRRNDEGNVGILDEGFGRQMLDIFHEDLNQSVKIELGPWLKRGFCEKFKEQFFALFRRRL